MGESLAEKALHAVAEYERWHAEVERLSFEIGASLCPHENPNASEEDGWYNPGSCFRNAADEELPDIPADAFGPAVPRKRSLAEIAEYPDVKKCPSCSRLCVLIVERKAARQQRGIAKRRVRHVGKLVLAPIQGEEKP